MLIILYKIMTFNQLMFRGPGLPFPTTPSPDLCLPPLHLPVCPLRLRSSTGPPSDQLCFHPFQEEDLHEFNINCLQFSENTEKTLTESVYASVHLPLLRSQPHCGTSSSSRSFFSPASSCTSFHLS